MVNSVEGGREIQKNKYDLFPLIKCDEDVILQTDQGCFHTVVRSIGRLCLCIQLIAKQVVMYLDDDSFFSYLSYLSN